MHRKRYETLLFRYLNAIFLFDLLDNYSGMTQMFPIHTTVLLYQGFTVPSLVEGASDVAQGRLAGGKGFLQIVARHVAKGRQSYHRIVGAHILGPGANDLIQLAALLVHTKCSIEFVANGLEGAPGHCRRNTYGKGKGLIAPQHSNDWEEAVPSGSTPWAAVTLSQLLQLAADDALAKSPFVVRHTT